ncbi:hypothetical protein L1987_11874 [Smallanthus sonchifolius]|uniref:Uncharacterized protein n=1 Tax=Smallanthus sonchifolius TaxID=185202 RepID=A0ACB9JD25_9ASTR|nr:hypothetical protein L1987_11874 [Smallanthus sonchifolius]
MSWLGILQGRHTKPAKHTLSIYQLVLNKSFISLSLPSASPLFFIESIQSNPISIISMVIHFLSISESQT